MIIPRIRQMPRFKAPSLGAQILIGVTLIGAALAVVAGITLHHLEWSYLDSLLSNESRHKFDLLVSASQDDVISQDIPRIQTSMNTALARDPALYYIRITSNSGHTLYFRQRHHGKVPPRLLYMARTVRVDGETFGSVAVAWNIEGLEDAAGDHSYLIASTVGGVCALLALLAVIAIQALAVVPIERMVQRLNEFQDGILDRVVALPRFTPAELRRLDTSINTLGDLLANKRLHDAERTKAQEAAIAANRTKSEFLANMSHELRTPLNAIIGFSELIQDQSFGPVGNSKYLQYAGDIGDAGHHLLSLVNDILDISRVEVGEMALAEDEFCLGAVISSALRLIKPRAEQNGLSLIQCLPAPSLHMIGDERKLKQVLLNLLSNAVKFTHRGGTITLKMMLHSQKGVIIEVADTGIGIPPDQIPKVLEPFQQIDNAMTRRYEGAGLGLPLAKALTELHGGTLELQSDLGVGTRARVTLPPSRIVAEPVEATNIVPLSRPSGLESGSEAPGLPSRQPVAAVEMPQS